MAKLWAAGQAPPPRPARELLPTSTSASISYHCLTSIPGSLASDDCTRLFPTILVLSRLNYTYHGASRGVAVR